MEGGGMIGICVGHSRTGDSGALSVDDTSERFYNAGLAEMIATCLDGWNIPSTVIASYPAATYPAAMKWLAGELRRMGAVVAVELHFNNSHVRAASGHEWLYWQGSAGGRSVALALEKYFRLVFPKSLRRGCKPIGPKDNGAGFLKMVPCPSVICEPFFGTNHADWETVAGKPYHIAEAIANGLRLCYPLFLKGWKP
jgi:hypothetical protein